MVIDDAKEALLRLIVLDLGGEILPALKPFLMLAEGHGELRVLREVKRLRPDRDRAEVELVVERDALIERYLSADGNVAIYLEYHRVFLCRVGDGRDARHAPPVARAYSASSGEVFFAALGVSTGFSIRPLAARRSA